jgi:hypothetical protein
MDFIHIGALTDVGDSYYFSNWGAAGLCRAFPELNVKPAFVALATLTRVLDGARFVTDRQTGSPSVYALEFRKLGGETVLAFWTIRGKRPLHLSTSGGPWILVDGQSNEMTAPTPVVATPSPNYIVGRGKISLINLGEPSYEDRPPPGATVIDPLDRPNAWKKLAERSPELESYDYASPRRKGQFNIAVTHGAGDGRPALRIEPARLPAGVETMPTYERFAAATPLRLPGKPNEIGVWVYGNSGWGRIIFELRDAKGQRWINLGAESSDPSDETNAWNSDDAYGINRINFDGWRYLGFPLPGNYPGEQHPWPTTTNWRWSGDGIVRYPLTLEGLAIVLPEKVLHVKTWAAAPRQEIYLRDLTVGYRPEWLTWRRDLPGDFQ